MRLSIARMSAGGSATGDAMNRDEAGSTSALLRGAGWPWCSRPSWCSAASASLFGSSEAGGCRPPSSQPGQVFASVGVSTGQRLRPLVGQPDQHAQRTAPASPTPRAARSMPAATSTSPTTSTARSANSRRPALRCRRSPPGCRTRSPLSSTTRETSTWGSRARPTSRSSTRRAAHRPTSGPSPPVRRR